MRIFSKVFLFATALALALNGCGANQTPNITIAMITSPTMSPTVTSVLPTPTITPIPKGKTIIVTSAEDNGAGTLRQAIYDAQPSAIITFDPTVFPPKNPKAIELKSGLPPITQGYLTLDASNAGVILDGSQAGGDGTPGIEINSEHNVIRGLQSIHFTGPGIFLDEAAKFNTIGGDRAIGSGPLGQGNLFSDDSDGVGIRGSDNTISGNLIGTDVTGHKKLGNKAQGVFFEGIDASRNVVGPSNTIAYNGTRGDGSGILIQSVKTQANVITANSIHDNTNKGISYVMANRAQGLPWTTPIILDFDLDSGTANGITCANCAVEIFSTHTNDGEIYEGSVTADQYGDFSFNKGQPLTGPSLTSTSRSPDNYTSEFSMPTTGTKRVVVLQGQNTNPRVLLVVKLSNELEDNQIGQLYDKFYLLEGNLQANLNSEVIEQGMKYLKLSITEIEPETNMGGNKALIAWDVPEFSFGPEEEKFITSAAKNGITVDYILNFWDKANHPQGWQPARSRFKTQEEIQRYLEYVRFIVNHFKGRVSSYEIWNEPGNKIPLQWIQPADYINLVRQTIPIIRQEDPSAKIVVGSVNRLSDAYQKTYLFTILQSDIMPLVDVVTWHPNDGASPEHNKDYYYAYPSIIHQIKDTAESHGFQGSYRADEITYRELDCTYCDPGDPSYSNIQAAKYHVRGIIMSLGMDLGTTVGDVSSRQKLLYGVIQNICTLMAGAKVENLPFELQSKATPIKYYSFSLPNGDKLVAVWNDGKAVDDDLSISSTITFPGFAGWKATGIDVLNGFEQELNSDSENGNMILHDFLLKDYPIIIRLSK